MSYDLHAYPPGDPDLEDDEFEVEDDEEDEPDFDEWTDDDQ